MDPDTIMDTELILQDMILAPLSTLEVQGKIRKVSQSQHSVAVNSRKQGMWEAENKTLDFPFKNSDNFKVIIYFDGAEFNIVSQDCHHMTFPNRSGLHLFNYLKVGGNIDLQLLKLTN